MMEEDFEWQPPSEAELKIIQARRERSDQISKRMGDYLLKGYKMLSITCPECATILLQDKQGVNYCIACRELDTDTDKDNPAVNHTAARSQILEGSMTEEHMSQLDDLSYLRPQPPDTPTTTTPANQQPVSIATVTSSLQASQSGGVNVGESIETLCQKINFSTAELRQSSSVEHCIKLCELIKACADAIQSLKSIS